MLHSQFVPIPRGDYLSTASDKSTRKLHPTFRVKVDLEFYPNMSFDTLGLSAELLRAVEEQGYREPTPIQSQAIPVVLQRRDLMASAQTGTAKPQALRCRCYSCFLRMRSR